MDACVEAKIEADQTLGRLPEDALKNRKNINHSHIRVLLHTMAIGKPREKVHKF
jgi:hypothetical protein